jgi:hypothetical protein
MKSNTIIKVIEIVYFGKSSRKEGTIEMILYKYGLGFTKLKYCFSLFYMTHDLHNIALSLHSSLVKPLQLTLPCMMLQSVTVFNFFASI